MSWCKTYFGNGRTVRTDRITFRANTVGNDCHMTHATDVSATAAPAGSRDDDVILRPANRRAIRRDTDEPRPRRRRLDTNGTSSTSSGDVTPPCDVSDSPVASAAARSSELTDDTRRPAVPPELGVPAGVPPAGVFDVLLLFFPPSTTNSLQPKCRNIC